MRDFKKYKEIVYEIIGSAMNVHSEMKWGLMEAVYQEALHLELNDRDIYNEREKEINLHYKHHQMEKRYKMDIVVDDVIVELKSVTRLLPVHRAQLCNYLRLTNSPIGLLINFGEEDLKGERWAYDEETNKCFLVDKDMNPVYEKDYLELLTFPATDEENWNTEKILMTD